MMAIMLFVFTACEDEDAAPITVFDDLGIGAYPRLIEQFTNPELDIANFSTSEYRFQVDFVDGEGGSAIESYNFFVDFQDRNSGNGDDSKAEVLYRSFGPSDFSMGPRGNMGITVTIPLQDLITLFGLDPSNFVSGDRFRFRTEVIKGGQSFTNANSSSAITNASFAGEFDFNLLLTCPLDDSFLVGNYVGEYTSAVPDTPFGSATFGATPGTFTFSAVAGSSTQRSFGFDYLPDRSSPFTDRSGSLAFECDIVRVLDIDTGVGCGSGSIVIGSGDSPGGFDLTDDSEFTVNFVDFTEDGGCGVAAIPFSMRFTKQ